MIKKEIYFLSTIHSMEEVASGISGEGGRSVKTLRVISDKNYMLIIMIDVDKNDAMVGNYSCVRKSYRWTTKSVFAFY